MSSGKQAVLLLEQAYHTERRSQHMRDKQTFLIHVIETQNSTWQGRITWLEQKKKENFRSLLELIKLMDAAIVSEDGEGG